MDLAQTKPAAYVGCTREDEKLTRSFVRLYGPLVAVMLLVITATLFLVDPAPPTQVVIAGGAEGGAYAQAARAYRAALAKHGVEATILDTAGSVANIELLTSGKADIAIVQTGVAADMEIEGLESLGAVFYEPMWVFHRTEVTIGDLRDFAGLRVAIGDTGSGVRALANALLTETGVAPKTFTASPLSGSRAAAALVAGEIDVMLGVSGASAPWIKQLAANPSVALLSMRRAEGWNRRHSYLGRVVLFEGSLDPAGNVPSADIQLIAPTAQIVVSDTLHPAIQSLIIEAAYDVHGRGTVFAKPSQFPTKTLVDLPLSDEAKRYYTKGPSFLRRVFSFGVANFLERAWILLIPLLTLLIPVVRAAPPIYRWSIRRKIYVWYRDLRGLEAEGRAATTPDERNSVRERLAALQAETGKVEVPLSYTDNLYRLRSHIDFVVALLDRLPATADSTDEPA